jgi:ubiquitin carboxyl-terminal hydrolase 25/28
MKEKLVYINLTTFLESGHYYVYIYDFEQKVWRKYNDMNVTEEEEKSIFERSYGGVGKASAYFLVY